MTKNRPVLPRPGGICSLITDQRGSALVEELVTVAVIGLGLSILVAMITTGAVGVRMIDDRSTAEILARSQLELIAEAPYQADPAANPYPTPAPVPGYTISVSFRYWDSTSSSFTPSTVNDGLQEVTITVSDSDGPLYSLSGYKTDR
jgi:hypothetical protein